MKTDRPTPHTSTGATLFPKWHAVVGLALVALLSGWWATSFGVPTTPRGDLGLAPSHARSGLALTASAADSREFLLKGRSAGLGLCGLPDDCDLPEEEEQVAGKSCPLALCSLPYGSAAPRAVPDDEHVGFLVDLGLDVRGPPLS